MSEPKTERERLDAVLEALDEMGFETYFRERTKTDAPCIIFPLSMAERLVKKLKENG